MTSALSTQPDISPEPTDKQFSFPMPLNRAQPPAMGPVAKLLAIDRTMLIAASTPLAKVSDDRVDSEHRTAAC